MAVLKPERNAVEIAMFGFLAVSTIGTALGSLPPSLRQAPHIGQAAAIGLCLGSVLALVGLLWRNREDGLIIEQLGLALAGFGLLFYVVALSLSSAPSSAAIAVGLSAGLFAGCTVRYFQIQRYIHSRKQATDQAEA